MEMQRGPVDFHWTKLYRPNSVLKIQISMWAAAEIWNFPSRPETSAADLGQLFIWSYLSATLSRGCSVLEIPPPALGSADTTTTTPTSTKPSGHANPWMVCIVRWDVASTHSDKAVARCKSAGAVLCNRRTRALAYWPDIYVGGGNSPILSLPPPEEAEEIGLSGDGADSSSEYDWFNSFIASAIPGTSHECIVIGCQSNGNLWLFHLTPTGASRKRASQSACGDSCADRSPLQSKGQARSIIWRLQHVSSRDSSREFFLLTNNEIQCWNVVLARDVNIARVWSQEIVGSDGDLGIKKDLAGQKHIWLLDFQVDDRGKDFTILVATFCMDRVSSSSYTQYSLLTMQYKPVQHQELIGSMTERILERKAPLQVIIPKARVEDESFLLSMRLRIGGKPSGSAIILSGDGTATVTNYWRGSTRLYQFDLPWDAGRVLDASVFPSAEESDEGSWVVLTEKAGIWAIPEKAVLLGAVEPPERSLSRKGSSNEGVAEEEKRIQAFGSNITPRRVSSDAWSTGGRQRTVLTGIGQRTAQDEEAEALLGRLFNEFILSGEVEGAFEKLRVKGAFEKEGETNVFARVSKSIVDTLPKHWTTTKGAEFVASAVVSSLLLDKQQKHQKYLQFLALSKCHEELSSKQRQSLLTVMEHGEKLSGIIQLRELQNLLSQNHPEGSDSPPSHSGDQVAGALWDLIQLVGEKARRNTVLLMDRDNAEVFYSKVSDIEELFNCMSHHLPHIIGEHPYKLQMKRAYEIASACTTLIHAAMRYRDEYQTWYPSPERLTPWNCQSVVRSGLWNISSFIMQLLRETTVIDMLMKSNLWSQLEKLTDILLDAYTGLITSKIERGEEHRGLKEEYCKRRDELLCSLYELTKRFTDAKYQDSCKGVENFELKEAIFREAASPLLSIAKRHEGYQTLWCICYDLNDTAFLRNLMHDSVGPKGGFSYFVFKQLIKRRQYANLLRLGEEFQEQLSSFLKEHKHLFWLHEIFLNQFSCAAETLHALAISQDDTSALENEETEPTKLTPLPSLADRRRLLNLSKIAAAAGKDEGFEMKMVLIEADLRILKLQEEIMRHYPYREEVQDINKLLPPRELIEMCLKVKSRELSLLAFEVFAWTSSSFRIANRSLLEECWKNAVDQNDWAALSQASTAEGWSDEVVLETMKETILFKASQRCYGPEAEMYDGDFDEALPLQKEDAEMPGPSVEGILMLHKDFPDAGKLMLTALMMGKEAFNNIFEEEEEAMDF
ncbi:uncharacterized protein A4U43_C06F20170 [Asparagus officinalis]|uniref:Nucleoporin Nup133/Nup155-like N-terminal domain-containing protein n=1 Tax=Asparagus officinalis TaxID=4686 RepID=A0A5P1ETP4_ASPOF|nr:uncharacterized protein A4U43_C06F20170 [Asparagus officinalis]